jgi:polysaccharide export outer membrane protein
MIDRDIKGALRIAALAAGVLGGMLAAGQRDVRVLHAQAPVAPSDAGSVSTPADYVIGPEDVLSIVFWREKDMSADVVVRPDGKISLPLLNEVAAAGLTPEQLRASVQDNADRYLEDPTATVIVKQINSRKVYITGQVARPGPYPLGGASTVLQLIAMAGGLTEFADQEGVTIWRTDPAGNQVSYVFNYKAIARRRNLEQNILLRPGDTIVVP